MCDREHTLGLRSPQSDSRTGQSRDQGPRLIPQSVVERSGRGSSRGQPARHSAGLARACPRLGPNAHSAQGPQKEKRLDQPVWGDLELVPPSIVCLSLRGDSDAPGSRDNLSTPSLTMQMAGGGVRVFRPDGMGMAPRRILAVDDDVAAGSWGGRRLSLADYVIGTGTTRGATAAGGG
jgi:hypothetical protein